MRLVAAPWACHSLAVLTTGVQHTAAQEVKFEEAVQFICEYAEGKWPQFAGGKALHINGPKDASGNKTIGKQPHYLASYRARHYACAGPALNINSTTNIHYVARAGRSYSQVKQMVHGLQAALEVRGLRNKRLGFGAASSRYAAGFRSN